MRIIILNMAYGTGCARNFPHHLIRMHHYIRTQKKHLQQITDYLLSKKPDIMGLVEIDSGSFRTQNCNQIEFLAQELQLSPFSHLKYKSVWGRNILPILCHQHNAILYRIEPKSNMVHFLENGMKQLVLEVEFKDFSLFLIHLSISSSSRKKQIENLELILPHNRPFILAGDFNLFKGFSEIATLLKIFNLHSLNEKHIPTFPAWNSKLELDFALATKEIEADFEVDDVLLSDHKPLIIDVKKIMVKSEK